MDRLVDTNCINSVWGGGSVGSNMDVQVGHTSPCT